MSCTSDLPVTVEPRFLEAAAAQRWLRWCRTRLPWQQDRVQLFGREHACRRLSAFVAPVGYRYRYSGFEHRGTGVPRALAVLLERVNSQVGTAFNGILLTCYRDGEDRLGWHTDAERDLGPDPALAVLSLGAQRTLAFRTIARPRSSRRFELPSGSLLYMGPGTQRHWQHSVPARRDRGMRISLGFRTLVSA